MIDFGEEINKYKYILTVEEVAQKVGAENSEKDLIKILEMINDKINVKDSGSKKEEKANKVNEENESEE